MLVSRLPYTKMFKRTTSKVNIADCDLTISIFGKTVLHVKVSLEQIAKLG